METRDTDDPVLLAEMAVEQAYDGVLRSPLEAGPGQVEAARDLLRAAFALFRQTKLAAASARPLDTVRA